jgi:hypothetical protein
MNLPSASPAPSVTDVDKRREAQAPVGMAL